MWRALLVGVGGLLGSLARYWLTGMLAPLVLQTGVPWGTLLVNTSGSFAIGAILAAVVGRNWLSADLGAILGTGFCGGFTTMSSFSYEVVGLFEAGAHGVAVAYIALMLVSSVSAAWAGAALIRLI